MHEYDLITKLGQIAGIGGLSLGVLLLLFREIIKKKIFPNLNRIQAYNIIKLIIILTFLIATFGIAAWVWSEKKGESQSVSTESQDFSRIFYQGFDQKPDNLELSTMWLDGASGDWKGTFSKGYHTLCNISESNSASFTSAFRLIDDNGKDLDLSNSKVTIDVKLIPPSEKYSSIGILYRKGKGPEYYAFALNAGNSISLMQRTSTTMKILWSKEISDKNSNEFVRLTVVGDGSNIEMYVDNKLIGIQKDASLLKGNPGVFAYSKGCFMIDSFSLFKRKK